MGKIFLYSALLLFAGLSLDAQSGKKAIRKQAFHVQGNCEMCKSNIEKAARGKGVTAANWDAKTKILEIVYDTLRTNVAAIQRNIAYAGFDNEGYLAPATE